tara:strand:+ start:16702 stop:17943 length:1242 start_codon:yes stop_codon:yes gene_type:complete
MNNVKTTCQIFDSPIGKTIVFNNLYFINGEFIFNGNPISDISTYPNIYYKNTNYEKWCPKITELSDNVQFEIINRPHFFFKESLHYHPGHTLMDDIFSIFFSIDKCGLKYNPFTCIIDIHNNETESIYDCKGMFKLLFGNEAIPLHTLNKQQSSFVFKTFVVGNSDSGFSSFDRNYVSPYYNDIWKKFRNAFYKEADIKLEIGEKIIYANTTAKDDNLNTSLKDMLSNNNIDIIYWGSISNIKEQLNILKDVKIYISTDGSTATNSIFLPDNATLINLGRVYAIDSYKAIGYCCDYLYPALSYIDVLYFEDFYNLIMNDFNITPDSNNLLLLINSLNNNDVKLKRSDLYKAFEVYIADRVHPEVKLNNFSPNARLLISTYPDVNERAEIIKRFLNGNIPFECSEKVRQIKSNM